MEDWKKEVGAAVMVIASFANRDSTDRLHYRGGPTQGLGPTTECSKYSFLLPVVPLIRGPVP